MFLFAFQGVVVKSNYDKVVKAPNYFKQIDKNEKT